MYYVPGTVLKTPLELSHLILTKKCFEILLHTSDPVNKFCALGGVWGGGGWGEGASLACAPSQCRSPSIHHPKEVGPHPPLWGSLMGCPKVVGQSQGKPANSPPGPWQRGFFMHLQTLRPVQGGGEASLTSPAQCRGQGHEPHVSRPAQGMGARASCPGVHCRGWA